MRILYIATDIYRNTSAAIRNASLIKGLIENNLKVEIITLNYLEENEDKYLKEYLKKYKIPTYKIEIPFFNSIKKSQRKLLKKFSFFNNFKDLIKKNIFFPDNLFESIGNSIEFKKRNYDIIISSSDSKTSHFIAEKLLKKKKISGKWIQIWGDPWKNDIGIEKINFFLKKRIEYCEKKLLQKADQVFYISELTAKKISSEIKLKEKIDVLSRSYLIEQENKKDIFSKKAINMFYTGVLNKRNILPIMNAVKKNNSIFERKIYLKFYGCNREEYLKHEDDFIRFFDKVDLEKIEKIYKQADILLYIDNPKGATQIPGKIYDYRGTDNPILALVESEETEKILKKYEDIEVIKNNEVEIELNYILEKIKKRKIDYELSPKNVAKDFINKINF